MLLLLAALATVQFFMLAYAGHRIESLLRQLSHVRLTHAQDNHLDYAHAMWTKVRAQVLRDAAEDWPRVDAEAERKRLSWTTAPTGGSNSLVVRWLLARADRMEEVPDADTASQADND